MQHYNFLSVSQTHTHTHTYLALQTLDQVTDCHSRGDSVGVDDDVWRDPLTREGHILQSKHTKRLEDTTPAASLWIETY